MKCRNCKHLDKGWCAHKIDSPDPELERECKDYMQATNADRIRAMSDEELAKFLTHTVSDGCPPNMNWECKKDEDGWGACDKCWGKWLQQPAEEDT